MFVVKKRGELIRFGLFLVVIGLMAFYVASRVQMWQASRGPGTVPVGAPDKAAADPVKGSKPVTGPIIAGPQATDLLDAAENHSDGSDFFASTRMARERSRSALKETLKEIMENPNASEEARAQASEQYLALGKVIALEEQAEMMVQSRGFTDVLVSIGEKTVQVVIGATAPTDQQYLQVQDTVSGVTGRSVSAIRVRAIAK